MPNYRALKVNCPEASQALRRGSLRLLGSSCSVRRGRRAAANLMDDYSRQAGRRRQPARMRQARCDIVLARSPPPRNSGRREIGRLDREIGRVHLVYEVEDRHRRVARFGETATDLDIAQKRSGKTFTEQSDSAAKVMGAAHRRDFSCRPANATVNARNWVVAINCKA